ncbi:cysteine-rich receptor-like protein kinase 25 [Gastrolobium bilobum]|uniref:cysteine-rich receptor-like protein kinase 25 n=1 Tax=Gastrolobium bilobum TaxID=150636 RepID=UPI002AB1E535|nr:cysteine-rich receptor-like protein kinase 25 [Gastrolobium bilobum]
MSFSFNPKLFSILLFYILGFLIFAPAETASTFSHYNCTSMNTYARNSTYQFNINTLLTALSSKASASTNQGFYNTTISGINTSDTIYGLFMCTGYIELCGECVRNSIKTLASRCAFNKEAIMWSDECMVRYSNRSFFNTMEEKPSSCVQNKEDYRGVLESFNKVLRSLMEDLLTQASEAPMGSNKFAFKKEMISEDKFLFGLAQCIPNLSKDNCRQCLGDAMAYLQTSCARGKIGGRVLYPSCIVRYDPYLFHPLLLPIGKKRNLGALATTIIFHALVPVMNDFLILNFFGVVGEEITTEMNSLQFDFRSIQEATNKFSVENKIGEGGFGSVYWGMLPNNGQEIAVKRLTRNSSQGATEFKNEVLLIAKLQHRNLVRLLGFCMERDEKILIYEFVHNKSLDYYLFSRENHRKLTWPERYKIIRGIARGILYLHEDSHLKIIHRDLKPSNILLDSKMNAKISDFGLARIIGIDQMQGNTSIIAGTYGYMSPEYAMLGQFSVKSDVFSFGVIILEIVTGKRNVDFNGVDSIVDLLSHAWKKWRDGKILELLDPTLAHMFFETEVNRCIQIGLLCVQENPQQRPTMATIALYFNCDAMDLPLPKEPAFFMHGSTESRMTKKEFDDLGVI